MRTGRVFPLGWDLDKAAPVMGRPPMKHVIEFNPGIGADDHYDSFYPQGGTTWDSPSRISHPAHGFYNGCSADEITGQPGSRNGIDKIAQRGIVGRFSLLDLARYREDEGRPFAMTENDPVDATDLDAALAAASIEVRPGDILMLRFGWITWYEQASPGVRAAALSESIVKRGSPGLAHREDVAAWLWDHHVAAVVTDSPTLEELPVELSETGFLHYRLIPLLGIQIGELFALDDLAADCAEDGVHHGLFAAAPINKVGGIGSPGNAVAIK